MLTTYLYDIFSTEGVRSKLLVGNLACPISLLATYVLSVKWFLPEVMKNRKPFDLRKIIICYSFMLSFLNLVIALQLSRLILQTWDQRCQVNEVITDIFEAARGIAYHNYLLKYLELLDTIFFVLRKKRNQVTFLHVFHHTFILAVSLCGLRQERVAYYCGLAIQVNSFVHVVMYFYYGLAAIGPQVQKYLWWKRYLTLVQIMQFVYILSYAAYGHISGCEHFTTADWFLFFFVFIVMILFINFYIKSFHQEKLSPAQKDK